jgi:hypothetical protein
VDRLKLAGNVQASRQNTITQSSAGAAATAAGEEALTLDGPKASQEEQA